MSEPASSEPAPLVALAVVTSERGVLLVRRRDRTPLLAFPGGRVETGEAAAAAAAREVLEECGVVVEAGAEISRREHPVTGASLVYVACSAPSPDAPLTPALEEVESAEWFSFGAGFDEVFAAMPDLHLPVRHHLVGESVAGVRGRSRKAVGARNEVYSQDPLMPDGLRRPPAAPL